jgi:hypothetical protein
VRELLLETSQFTEEGSKMPDKKTLLEYNALTGESVSRELTTKEDEERLQFEAKALETQLTKQAKESARQSALTKLAALGLTEEEIAAL